MLHAFWTTVCLHSAAARPWAAHERHLCLHCAWELLRGRDPRVTLQFGRRLRHLAPIENVSLMFLSRRGRLAWAVIAHTLTALGMGVFILPLAILLVRSL